MIFLNFLTVTSSYFRKEHKSHSPSCHFILLKKAVEELTVEEFLKLQKERQKFHIVSKMCWIVAVVLIWLGCAVHISYPCLYLGKCIL